MLHSRRSRPSFWGKAAGATALVLLADTCFFGHRLGAAVGLFALLWAGLAAATNPAIRQSRAALSALAGAAALGFTLIDHPSFVGALLFWVALTTAALLPRTSTSTDTWKWVRRLANHAGLSAVGPIRDAARVRRLNEGACRLSLRALLPLAVLPLGGGAVFLALFASANPIIAEVLSRVRLPAFDLSSPLRMLFWIVALIVVWGVLRPPARGRAPPRRRPSLSRADPSAHLAPTPVALALVIFNLLFALENGLDLAFLWSGAGLPSGMTLAGYAHRGAYPLVGTALLAGAFSLVFLREGSETAERPLIRVLVGLWIAQNVFLMASSILRTVDYVQIYSLTRFRIAALLWMAMVAVGLALTGWRVWRRRSAVWLINVNAAVLVAVLVLFSVVDVGEVAASWNVTHARDAGGHGAALDLCYLARLGPSAVKPLFALKGQPVTPDLRERAAWVRGEAVRHLEKAQADWRGWTWRGSRRLSAARARNDAPARVGEHACDGRLIAPPPALAAAGPSPAIAIATHSLTTGVLP